MDLLKSVEKRTYKWVNAIFDPEVMKLDEESLGKLTQLDPTKSLFEDRQAELAAYYYISLDEAGKIASIEDKDALERMFTTPETDKGLLTNYRNAKMLYTGRMMMRYTRFTPASRLLQYLNSKFLPANRKNVKMLDYGCGVGDYGLAFASQGYAVTLLDIEGGNLDFSKWRFDQRNISCNVIAATDENLYPQLGRHDIVMAGEVLEHVRDPITVLKNIFAALPKGGYLWLSGYPEHEREVGGDHLPEAAEVRLEALKLLTANTTKVRVPLPGSLFKKV